MPNDPSAVARWLREAHVGSEDALGRLFEACRPYLLLIANEELASDLRAKAGASDLVQESLLEAHVAFGQFRGITEAELYGWLRQILRNNLANFTRRFRQTGKRHASCETPLDHGTSSTDFNGVVAIDPGPSPSQQAVSQELADAVDRALDGLPEKQSSVIRWRLEDKQSFQEIGKRLGLSENAAEKLFARAIRKVRLLLTTRP
ncbi:MAG TPA: sigma-70 family RNA polymerase sigma factor [Isosphaeraceae bacterium]|nr:sigma-70 family RNA polymerase sigma factor [Isosphaeraceae bacterium]